MSESPYAPPPAEPQPPTNPARYVFMVVVVAALGGMLLLLFGLAELKRWLEASHPVASEWLMPVLLTVIVLGALIVRLRAQRQGVQVCEVDARDALRKLGMAVDEPSTAAEIRAQFSETSFIRENLFSVIAAFAGVTWSVLLVLWASWPFNVLGAAVVVLGFIAMLYLTTRYDQRWIELAGNLLRAEHFYTRRTAEWPLEDVQGVVFDQKRTRILLRSCRGPLLVNHIDPPMLEGTELVRALIVRLAQTTQFAAELRETNGQPSVSCLYRKGMKPPAPDKQRNLLLGLTIISALTFGTGATYQYSLDYDRWSVGALEPHELKLSELIDHGPGENRHLIVTDFESGVVGDPDGRDTSFSLPLFPTDRTSREIEAVIRVDNMPDVDAAYALLQDGRANVICAAERREWWGEVAGPNLEKRNNRPLNSAWPLVEASKLPGEGQLSLGFSLALGCFVVASLLSVYALWKSV